MVRPAPLAATLSLLLAPLGAALAQQAPAPGAERETVPIDRLIQIVADKTGDAFIVDPRVRADVTLIGQDPAALDYSGLLAILAVHGYAAVRAGDHVQIVPDAAVRTLPVPLATSRESRPAGEVVTKVVTVSNVPAPFLVPILRPLIPQWGHLAANPCSNTLIVVDTAGNLARLEEVIAGVDIGEPYEPQGCEPGPPREEPAAEGVPRRRQ